jgi:3-oxoacyl-[acyl-carrier-protein] synthase II
MRMAGVTPDDVDYLNAHGTSTPVNDRSETAAARLAYGDAAYKIAVNSTKCMIGHTQGAASAHQLVVLCMTMRDQIVHPTINYENPDPDCDLDYVPNVARQADVGVAIVNGFGFGGQNAVTVFRRFA